MSHADRQPPLGVPSAAEAQADVRFAAYVADLPASAAQPDSDAQACRKLLAEDPQTLRALFDLAVAHSRPPDGRLDGWVWLAIYAVVAVVLAGAILLGRVIA